MDHQTRGWINYWNLIDSNSPLSFMVQLESLMNSVAVSRNMGVCDGHLQYVFKRLCNW